MLKIYDDLMNKKQIFCYWPWLCCMPLAVAFAKHLNVIGYDLNSAKINLYKSGIDPTKEVGDDAIKIQLFNLLLIRKICAKPNFILSPTYAY